ncbi:aromatic ring-hydroxylating dioxygenase subunit alpha [Allosalinactinospora lopnorensis]|uniref:aromatic ring-hydroxylating dioxygenase subunit alpha n=1 Tax=Allosalinactinospora lopnorensis TaxID=1352348 RepID=UPI000623C225|nr:aromatic ring-hydroxylating dioxygenase subunit alpha [Allosalinactinospora lopnorensis]
MFPLNAWYAVAWDVEVGRKLLSRTVCGRPVVLYRTQEGRAVALADTCWHRLVPLSMGSLHGDELQCGYHGIRYGADGRATHMPAQETINPSACVRSYPLVERHRYIWIWTGDPALAAPSLVPDLHWNDDPEWAGDGRTIHAECDYRLMDLTHETFLHGSSIGNAELNEVPFEVTHTDRTVTVSRWMYGIQAPPFWAAQLANRFPDYGGPVDRWQRITFEAPSTIRIDVGVAKAGTGAPEGDRSQGVNGYVLNALTPETDRTCHYFWAFARNYALGDQRITTQLREGVSGVFFEDETMLNAQQRAIEANPGYEFYNLNIDAGGMWARRLIQRMIDAETEGVGTAATEVARAGR